LFQSLVRFAFTFHCEVIVEVKDRALLKCVSGEFVMGRNGYYWFKNDIFHCGVMLGAKDGGLLKCVSCGFMIGGNGWDWFKKEWVAGHPTGGCV
jgi:hypothetical protein